MKIKSTEIKVRYAETDQMGVVHHAVYPIWFEACRTDFMEQLDYPYSRLEEEGIMTPLINLNCTYKKGAKYGETVLVSARIKKLSFIRIEIDYDVVRKEDGTLLCKGSTTLVWTDKQMNIINLKEKNPVLYNKLQEFVVES